MVKFSELKIHSAKIRYMISVDMDDYVGIDFIVSMPSSPTKKFKYGIRSMSDTERCDMSWLEPDLDDIPWIIESRQKNNIDFDLDFKTEDEAYNYIFNLCKLKNSDITVDKLFQVLTLNDDMCSVPITEENMKIVEEAFTVLNDSGNLLPEGFNYRGSYKGSEVEKAREILKNLKIE